MTDLSPYILANDREYLFDQMKSIFVSKDTKEYAILMAIRLSNLNLAYDMADWARIKRAYVDWLLLKSEIEDGNVAVVQKLFEEKSFGSYYNIQELIPLVFSCKNPEMIEYFINTNRFVFKEAQKEINPMTLCIRSRSLQSVKYLIEKHKIIPDSNDLLDAVLNEAKEIVDFFIKEFNLNIRENNDKILQEAALYKEVDYVDWLVQNYNCDIKNIQKTENKDVVIYCLNRGHWVEDFDKFFNWKKLKAEKNLLKDTRALALIYANTKNKDVAAKIQKILYKKNREVSKRGLFDL